MIYNTTDSNIEELIALADAEEADTVELERQFRDSGYDPDTKVAVEAIVLAERHLERRTR